MSDVEDDFLVRFVPCGSVGSAFRAELAHFCSRRAAQACQLGPPCAGHYTGTELGGGGRDAGCISVRRYVMHCFRCQCQPCQQQLRLSGISTFLSWLPLAAYLTCAFVFRQALCELVQKAQLDRLQLATLHTGALSRLPNLRALHLQHNLLTALPELHRVSPSLRFLSVAHNKLTALPPGLSGLTALFTLDASHNAIADCSCENVPTSLRYLNVRRTCLAGHSTFCIPVPSCENCHRQHQSLPMWRLRARCVCNLDRVSRSCAGERESVQHQCCLARNTRRPAARAAQPSRAQRRVFVQRSVLLGCFRGAI